MRGKTLATLCCVVGLALAGAACGDDTDGGSPDITAFTEAGTQFDVRVGDEFTIALESNASTGHTWQLATELPADVVRLIGDEYIEQQNTSVVGAAGRQELRFKALGVGTATIDLWYVRPFDDPLEPADQASYTLTVTSRG